MLRSLVLFCVAFRDVILMFRTERSTGKTIHPHHCYSFSTSSGSPVIAFVSLSFIRVFDTATFCIRVFILCLNVFVCENSHWCHRHENSHFFTQIMLVHDPMNKICEKRFRIVTSFNPATNASRYIERCHADREREYMRKIISHHILLRERIVLSLFLVPSDSPSENRSISLALDRCRARRCPVGCSPRVNLSNNK